MAPDFDGSHHRAAAWACAEWRVRGRAPSFTACREGAAAPRTTWRRRHWT